MARRPAFIVAWSLFAVAVAATIVLLVLRFVGSDTSHEYGSSELDTVFAFALLSFPAVGALIASRRPENPVGWLFCATGVLFAIQGAASAYTFQTNSVDLPARHFVAWAFTWLTTAAVIPGVFLLLLFPDGRPPSPRWRVFAWIVGAVGIVHLLVAAFSPGPLFMVPEVQNPLAIEAAARVLGVALTVTLPAYFWPVAWLAGAASLVMRYRKAGWEQRQQIKWFASAAPVLAAGIGLYIAAFDWDPASLRSPLLRDSGYVVFTIGVVALALASGMAILKRRLLEIDVILKKSAVYTALTVLIVAVYLGIAAALGVAAGGQVPVAVAIIVTALGTLALQPVRRSLEGFLEGRLFGRRLSGEDVLHGFGTSLQQTGDPQELLNRLAATARRGLDLRWARLSLHSGATTTEGRPRGSAALIVPIAQGGEELGVIECGPKANGVLSDKDAELLATLAVQAALAVRNARLAARIVQAQDAERRRIERNIHDGAQQQLAALVANLGQARERLRREGKISEAFLAELQAAAVAILGELQELARGIYPSVLTDGGLAAAVSDRCAGLPIPVRMEAGRSAGQRFPPDIEGAGYFVAMEALANTLKHAAANSAIVRLDASNGKVTVEVCDDGIGFDTKLVRSGGLTNLGDRVAALGGVLRIESCAGEGTRVRAELPTRHGEPIRG